MVCNRIKCMIVCIGLLLIGILGTTSVYADDGVNASGVHRGIPWKITDSWELQIGTNGQTVIQENENGTLPGWLYYRSFIESVKVMGPIKLCDSCDNYFFNLDAVKNMDLALLDTSNVTNMEAMFADCTSLEEINLTSFNTSNVTDMAMMFSNCKSLKSLDLSGFDTTATTPVDGTIEMLSNCISLTRIALGEKTLFHSSIPNNHWTRVATLDGKTVDGPTYDDLYCHTAPREYPGWYEVKGTPIKKVSVKKKVSYKKNGAEPEVQVIGEDGRSLKSGVDYECWSEPDYGSTNYNLGYQIAKIRGKGKYSGYFERQFEIIPDKPILKSAKTYRITKGKAKGYTQIELTLKKKAACKPTFYYVEVGRTKNTMSLEAKVKSNNKKIWLYAPLEKGKTYYISVTSYKKMKYDPNTLYTSSYRSKILKIKGK